MATPNRPPLSPAAQAVWDAAVRAEPGQAISAALKAAADEVVPACSTRSDRGTQRMMIRHEFLAIAAELEAQP